MSIATEKLCNSCRKHLSFTNFAKNKTLFDGYSARCRKCTKKGNMIYRENAKSKPKVAPPLLRICRTCKIEKSITLFTQQSSSKDGYRTLCKECGAKNSKKWKENNPVAYKNNLRKCIYGITADTYNKMLISQGNACAICEKNLALHIDHCHKTGEVRGLLCRNCNHGLGNFTDSIKNLENAIKYLEGEI